ncbi:MAG: tetratricopeptide repeat protein [bacterium]|nr:tetratricopeptide repeat protein [bacterium]
MTDPKPEAWDRLQELFRAALDRNADQRDAFVAEACGGDRALQARLEELLVGHQKAQQVPQFLTPDETSWSELLEETVSETPPDAPVHSLRRIAGYHIKRVIATGGMGTVYEAVQEHPRRTVAAKVMKQGIASRSALRRFEYESQILARLRHPGIAQVYEAGTHQLEPSLDREGADFAGTVPYFAMEYIPNAKPINKYAEEKKLGTRERLALFSQVCDAVHHGHQKGIVHRDLKPGNILVDSQGQVKIIDFGVARGTDSDLAVTTLQTDIGQLIGTLQYMSPEQCEADPHDIDTRSDVYALGVVLYDLLCGKLPYDVTRVAMYEATRVIREQQPTKLTTIDKSLKGDVETIVFKTLEKDRDRRYQSADELRRDIEHYLKGELISARPPSVAYQLRIFARRNKALAAGAAVAFVALTVGVIGTSIGLLKARAAQKEAEQVTVFLEDMIAFANPFETKRPNLTMREALDRASKTIGEEFKDKPLIEARLRHTIGETYQGLGVYTEADLHLRTALQIRRRILGDEHPQTLGSLHALGVMLQRARKPDESESLLRQAVEIRRRVLGGEHSDTLWSMCELGCVLGNQSKIVEAEKLLRSTIDTSRRVLGDEDGCTLWSMGQLAYILWNQGEFTEAETLLREALQTYRRVFGEEHTNTVWTLINLAFQLESQDKDVEAEKLHRQTLEIRRRVLGPEHGMTVGSMVNVAGSLRGQGSYVEAEKLLRQALEIERRVRGHEQPDTLSIMSRLASNLRQQGKYTEGNTLHRQTLEIRRRVLGDEHLHTLASMGHVSYFLRLQGNYAEAERLLRQMVDGHRRLQGEEHAYTVSSLSGLVDVLRAQGKLDEARPYVAELIAHRKRAAEGSDASPRALNNYAWLLLTCDPGDLRDPEAALPIAQRAVEISDAQDADFLDTLALAQKMTGDLDQAIETQQKAVALLPPDDWQRRAGFESTLADFLTEAGRFAEAEPRLLDSYAESKENPQELPLQVQAVRLHEALERIVKLYEAWGKADQAARWRAKFEAVQAAPETDATTTQESRH